MCNGVLKLDRDNVPNDYTLPYDPEWQKSGDEPGLWLTVKDRFSVRIHLTDEGIVVDVFARGHEDEGAIASTYSFDNETICDCPEHPWNTEV